MVSHVRNLAIASLSATCLYGLTTEVASAERIAVATSPCAVPDADGIAYNPVTDELALVSGRQVELYLSDTACALRATISLAPIGAADPVGITYDAQNDQYIVADEGAAELFVLDTAGNVAGQCDLAPIGGTSLGAVSVTDTAGVYAVVDNGADQVLLVGRGELSGDACEVLGSFELPSLSFFALTYVSPLGQYLIHDSLTEELVLLDQSFAEAERFAFPGTRVFPGGLTYQEAANTLYALDDDALYPIDIFGSLERVCDTDVVGSGPPRAVAFIDSRNEFVYLDDSAYIVADASTCQPKRVVPLSEDFDFRDGLTYLPDANELVLSGQEQVIGLGGNVGRLTFVDYDTGELRRECRPSGGSLKVSDVDFIRDLQQLAWVGEESAGLMDLDCGVTLALSIGGQIGEFPESIAFQATSGRFLVVANDDDDLQRDEGSSIDSTGGEPFALRLDPVIREVTGVAQLADGAFLVSDAASNAIYRLDVPMTATPSGLSGTYQSSEVGVRVVLLEQGGGRFFGLLNPASERLPVFGQITGSRVSFAYRDAGGVAVAVSGTLAEDLQSIQLPLPLGRLVRE